MADYTPYDVFTPGEAEVPFRHFGKLLPVLMILILPSLLLDYGASMTHIHFVFVAASMITISLIVSSVILIIISGILGWMEARKYQRLAQMNSHPRPRRGNIIN